MLGRTSRGDPRFVCRFSGTSATLGGSFSRRTCTATLGPRTSDGSGSTLTQTRCCKRSVGKALPVRGRYIMEFGCGRLGGLAPAGDPFPCCVLSPLLQGEGSEPEDPLRVSLLSWGQERRTRAPASSLGPSHTRVRRGKIYLFMRAQKGGEPEEHARLLPHMARDHDLPRTRA